VIETHLFDFDKNIYGQYIRIEFVEFLREEIKFNSLEDLKTQLQQDKLTSLDILVDN
jgi:riboflavin kinase/FMN adenylyltransferase